MDTLDGKFGLFILPDLATARRAHELAADTVSPPDYTVAMPAIPLFFAPLVGFPLRVAVGHVRNLRRYRGYGFRMQSVATKGGKAVFWEAVSDDELRRMQSVCAEALSRWRIPTDDAVSTRHPLDLDPDQTASMTRFGYPWMGRFFILLAYRKAGFGKETVTVSHAASIRDVVFAEVGPHCSIKRVVPLAA